MIARNYAVVTASNPGVDKTNDCFFAPICYSYFGREQSRPSKTGLKELEALFCFFREKFQSVTIEFALHHAQLR